MAPLLSGAAVILLLFGLCVALRHRPTDARPPTPPARPVGVPSRALTEVAVATPTAPPAPLVETYALDVCGVGQVQFDSDDVMAPGRYVESISMDAQRRWRAALLESGDNRARAVGLYLDVLDSRREAQIHVQNESHGAAQEAPNEQPRDALVQLATGSADPAVYSIAVQACGTFSNLPTSVACRQISLSAWTRIDADNAVPWLLLAGKARASGDSAIEEAAFARAAAAHVNNYYSDSLYAYARAEFPGDLTPLQQYFLALGLVGVQSAWALPQYRIVTQHCSVDRMQTPIAHQQCDALAENFVGHGKTVLDLGMGTKLGERAGWPAQRVSALTEERKALQQMGPHDLDMWGCETVRRGNDFLGRVARMGELVALRDALERSGQSHAEVAQEFDLFMQALSDNARLNPAVRKQNQALQKDFDAAQAAAARSQAEAASGVEHADAVSASDQRE